MKFRPLHDRIVVRRITAEEDSHLVVWGFARTVDP